MAGETTAGELIVDVLADVSELKTGLGEVRNILKKSNTKVGAFQKIWTGALRRVGEKATDFAFKAVKAPFSLALKSVVGLGKGMARLAKTSVLDAAKFQTRLSEVASLGVQQMGALRDGILEVSAAVGQDLIVSTQAAYQAISAGIPEGNVIDFLKVGSKAAIAGVTDMETAVNALSSAVNAYGASADEAIDFSDQFFQTIKLGKTTFAELDQSLGTVLPTAAALGVEFNEVGGAIALMTQKGIDTNRAVTALNQLLLQLLKPADEVAEAVGKIVKNAGGFQDLDLSKVIGQFSSLSTQVQVGLVGSVEAVKAVLALGGDGAGAERETIIEKIAQDAVEAAVELKDLKKKEEALAETRGLKRFSEGLSALEASATGLGIPMENVAAALGTMVERGTATTTAVGSLQKIFSALENPSANVEKAINAIVKDAGGLENIDLQKVVEEFGNLDKKVREDILGGVREVNAALALTDKKGANAFEDKLDDIERAAKKAARSATTEFSELSKVMAEIGGAEGATETALAQFTGDLELEKNKLMAAIKGFTTEVATPVAEAIGEVFAQINEKISPVLAPIAKIIKEWFTDLWEGGFDKQALQQMADGMSISIEEAAELAGVDLNQSPSMKSTLLGIATNIGETLSSDIQKFQAAPEGTPIVRLFAKWAKDLRENIGPATKEIFGTNFITALSASWEKHKDAILKIAKDVGGAIGEGIVTAMKSAVTAFFPDLERVLNRIREEGVIGTFAGPSNLPRDRERPPILDIPDVTLGGASLAQRIAGGAAPAAAPAATSGGGGDQQRAVNITINQLPGEDSMTLANKIREVLLDIDRFGNSRGIVAAEAF